ncbi:Similar to GTF3C3: General transcription factor 3C polypeptide 3 (Homo sapiens), partial [Cotesia congregata]
TGKKFSKMEELNTKDKTPEIEEIMEPAGEIAPVIIEELSQVDALRVDINEFVEATICHLPADSSNRDEEDNNLVIETGQASDDEDNQTMTPEEEARITRQFLNGEMSFSDFSLLMDRGADGDPQQVAENQNRRLQLPTALKGLMGEANLQYARGHNEVAIRMCMEIIREVPSAPEAYQTLSMIYESEDPEKALHFALIAAHLSPKDCDQWINLANKSLQRRDLRQAITCYLKAIASNPKNVSLYESYAKLQLDYNGDEEAYFKAYKKLLKKLDTEDNEVLVHYAKKLAKMYTEKENYLEAANAMDQIFSKCPSRVTYDDVNIYAEFLIKLKKFRRCLDILISHTGIGVKYSDDERKIIESCCLPDDTPIDLKVRFIVTMLELGFTKQVLGHMDALLAYEEAEKFGDLFLDIVDGLMHVQEYARALKFLELLIRCKNYSMPAVWLRYAECHVGCRQLKEAILAYEIKYCLSFGRPLQDTVLTFHESKTPPTDQQEWMIFLKACHVAYKLKKFGVLQRICFTGLTSKKFESQIRDLTWLCLLSCIYNNDSFNGHNIIRELVRDTHEQNLWNLLNIVVQKADDTRHNRFIMRLLGRVDVQSYLHILQANNCLVSGTYKYALNDYFPEPPHDKIIKENLELLDIRREAAFNIHLIYLQTGNKELARMYLHEFIVV